MSYFKPTQVMDVHAAVRTGTEPSLLKAALRRTARCLMDGQAGAPLSREAEYYSLLTFFWGYYNPYYTIYWTLYTGHAGLFCEQMPRHAVQLFFPGILYPRCCHACQLVQSHSRPNSLARPTCPGPFGRQTDGRCV